MAMNPIILLFLLSLFTNVLEVEPAKPRLPGKSRLPNSHIIVMGFVYCDTCSNNSFTRHSYFLSGAEVKIDCIFKALSPKTDEQITLSVNRTTDKYGMYKLEIPSVDGVKCAEDPDVASSCLASLIWSPSSSCSVPGYRSTSNSISVKGKRDNICIYSLNPLSYRPSKKDITLCGS
ncbi:major pollen allergen Ole e 1 [Senna tora]|uniref:Major pollen allergen Ole e 1 n=1 Tax=Senna tora TaxID=362788 RepID=A0A834TKW1_9FABA|nr:major pollen allergen Ole e 1 [Senna tora]